MNEKNFYVYMLANKKNGTIYKGMSSNVIKRIYDHKNKNGSKFTSKYEVKKLVWYKRCDTFEEAVKWEKRLRRYPRRWKINLIEEKNENWQDLWNEINGLHGQAV
ncbi:MAG: GIY-YIG nuclease family protein [Pseudomonadota bacterium]